MNALIESIQAQGYPFADDSKELFSLIAKDVKDGDIVERARKLKQVGNDQYKTFVEQRLVSNVKTIADTVPRTKMLQAV